LFSTEIQKAGWGAEGTQAEGRAIDGAVTSNMANRAGGEWVHQHFWIEPHDLVMDISGYFLAP
jgi:hypothetical protein